MMNYSGRLCDTHLLAYIFVIIGALNWGLVAIGGYTDMNLNVVNLLLGMWPMVERAVYLVVGIAAIVMLFQSSCTLCNAKHPNR